MNKLIRLYYKIKAKKCDKQLMLSIIILVLLMIVTLGLGIAKTFSESKEQEEQSTDTVQTTSALSTDVIMESVSVSDENNETEYAEEIETKNNITYVDFDVLYSFMSEDSLLKLKEEVGNICMSGGVEKAVKLSYQKTDEKSMNVKFFIMLSNQTVYECNYSLGKNNFSLQKSNLTEEDLNTLQKDEEKARLKALEKERKKNDKKLERARKKAQKKKKKKATDGG